MSDGWGKMEWKQTVPSGGVLASFGTRVDPGAGDPLGGPYEPPMRFPCDREWLREQLIIILKTIKTSGGPASGVGGFRGGLDDFLERIRTGGNQFPGPGINEQAG